MSTASLPISARSVVYPDSDGKPIAENTLQFEWIVKITENLRHLFANDPEVFIAGDLFWYPVEGHPEIVAAPDTMVVFGRPPGHRGSYRQWEEAGIAPQVVFEVLSPGNRSRELASKFEFYQRYGVEEYYIYDPDRLELSGYVRRQGELEPIARIDGFVSPRLRITFSMKPDGLQIIGREGRPFVTFEEIAAAEESARQQKEQAWRMAQRAEELAKMASDRAAQERERAEKEQARAEEQRIRAEEQQARAEQLQAELDRLRRGL